jgi:hypothetical protein
MLALPCAGTTTSSSSLRLLEQRLAVKQDVLEQFKSRNAVLKNSLLYLPLARDELIRVLPLDLQRAVNSTLVEYLLLNRVNGALLERGDISRDDRCAAGAADRRTAGQCTSQA